MKHSLLLIIFLLALHSPAEARGGGGGGSKNPPVNGVCGTANGATVSAKPTSGLCSTGTATNVSGVGPWSWSCNGSNGGSNASCADLLLVVAPPPPAIVQAVTAYSFVDSLGVNTHYDYQLPSNAYYAAELAYLGIRYARDSVSSTPTWPLMQAANASTGVKFDILLDNSMPLTTELSLLATDPAILTTLEGPNEIDNWPVTYNGSTGYSAAKAFQQALYADVKANSKLYTFPVYSLTIAYANDVSSIGNISAYCDYLNVHAYSQWEANSEASIPFIQYRIAGDEALAPNKPVVITEFGYWTIPTTGNSNNVAGVPYAVQAKNVLNFFFDAFSLGVHRSYVYELMDDGADPSGSNVEDHFGLFDATGAPKPAATALANLTTLLADPSPLAAPASLNLTVNSSGDAKPIYSLLMERGDGTFVLALWQDAAVWNYSAGTAITVNPEQALVGFGYTAQAVEIYDPTIGLTAQSTYSNIGGLTVSVPDHPVLVFFR